MFKVLTSMFSIIMASVCFNDCSKPALVVICKLSVNYSKPSLVVICKLSVNYSKSGHIYIATVYIYTMASWPPLSHKNVTGGISVLQIIPIPSNW